MTIDNCPGLVDPQQINPACQDPDVGQDDYAIFAICENGPGNAPNPICME